MPRKPPPLDAELLTGIRRELARLKGFSDKYLYSLGYHDWLRVTIKDARRNLLRIDFETWLGWSLSEAERHAAQRALVRLHRAGKIVRIADGHVGNRATCIEVVTRAKK